MRSNQGENVENGWCNVYILREHRLRVFYMYVRRRFFSLRIAIFNKILEMTSIEMQK